MLAPSIPSTLFPLFPQFFTIDHDKFSIPFPTQGGDKVEGEDNKGREPRSG